MELICLWDENVQCARGKSILPKFLFGDYLYKIFFPITMLNCFMCDSVWGVSWNQKVLFLLIPFISCKLMLKKWYCVLKDTQACHQFWEKLAEATWIFEQIVLMGNIKSSGGGSTYAEGAGFGNLNRKTTEWVGSLSWVGVKKKLSKSSQSSILLYPLRACSCLICWILAQLGKIWPCKRACSFYLESRADK